MRGMAVPAFQFHYEIYLERCLIRDAFKYTCIYILNIRSASTHNTIRIFMKEKFNLEKNNMRQIKENRYIS